MFRCNLKNFFFSDIWFIILQSYTSAFIIRDNLRFFIHFAIHPCSEYFTWTIYKTDLNKHTSQQIRFYIGNNKLPFQLILVFIQVLVGYFSFMICVYIIPDGLNVFVVQPVLVCPSCRISFNDFWERVSVAVVSFMFDWNSESTI